VDKDDSQEKQDRHITKEISEETKDLDLETEDQGNNKIMKSKLQADEMESSPSTASDDSYDSPVDFATQKVKTVTFSKIEEGEMSAHFTTSIDETLNSENYQQDTDDESDGDLQTLFDEFGTSSDDNRLETAETDDENSDDLASLQNNAKETLSLMVSNPKPFFSTQTSSQLESNDFSSDEETSSSDEILLADFSKETPAIESKPAPEIKQSTRKRTPSAKLRSANESMNLSKRRRVQ